MGSVIVGAVPGFEETLDAVRHHHERWDGKGYPFGLRGEETPFLARLIAVADAFSAMTTDRPYRKGMEREQGIKDFRRGGRDTVGPGMCSRFAAGILSSPKPPAQAIVRRIRGAGCRPLLRLKRQHRCFRDSQRSGCRAACFNSLKIRINRHAGVLAQVEKSFSRTARFADSSPVYPPK